MSASKLRPALKGRVIAPSEAGYDEARTIFYGGFDYQPAVIIRPADVADVSHVVSMARETGMELAVRRGGHSIAGLSTSDGGVVLDLKDRREMYPTRQTP